MTSLLLPGTHLGRYVIATKLGAGAMGTVYVAHDPELDRMVALKLLHHSGLAGDEREFVRERLRREAQAMAQLAHPNVVAVYDVGVVDHHTFIAMELVEGQTLAAWLSSTRPSWRATVTMFLAAGQGLVAAHRADLVHRDFKPENVLIGNDGRVRVGDFGLARVLASDASDGSCKSSLSGSPSLPTSTTGAPAGTPYYMAPEQFLCAPPEPRSDQFSFCVALYAAIACHHPFEGENIKELAESVVDGRLRAPPNHRVMPRQIHRALRRGLSGNPKERYPSMDALLAELRAAVAHVGAGRKWAWIVAVGSVLITFLGFTFVGAFTPRAINPTGHSMSFATAPQQQLTFSGEASWPSMSGNSRLAYALGRDRHAVIVNDLKVGTLTRISNTDMLDGTALRWAPDGTKLAIHDDSDVWVVAPSDGAQPYRILAAATASWSADGKRIVSSNIFSPSALLITDVRTGQLSRSTPIPPTFVDAVWQTIFDWSEADRVWLLTLLSGGGFAVWSIRTDGTDPREIYRDRLGMDVDYTAWYRRGRALYFQRLRDQTAEIVRLTLDASDHVTGEQVVFSSPAFGDGFAISDDERSLIYARTERSTALSVVSNRGNTVLVRDTRAKQNLAISPDGRLLAYIAGAGERREIVVVPRRGGTTTTVSIANGRPLALAWAPKGDRLAYVVATPTGAQLWHVSLNGGVAERVLTKAPVSADGNDVAWTARGELLAQSEGHRDYVVVAPGKPERMLLGEEGWAFNAMPSPDGRRVALQWNSPPRRGLWVVEMDGGRKTQISTQFALPIGWSDDGSSIYAQIRSGAVLAMDVAGTGRSTVALAAPPPSIRKVVRPLPHSEGFAVLEESWESDLWLVSLDGRRIDTIPTTLPAAPRAVVLPSLHNGAMNDGSLGAAPSGWIPSGYAGETAVLVDNCGGRAQQCAMLSRGGVLEQRVDAAPYRGRRIRLRARGRADAHAYGYVEVLAQTSTGVWDSSYRATVPHNWSTIQFDSDIQADADAVVLRLGVGPDSAELRVWFDDISIEPVQP